VLQHHAAGANADAPGLGQQVGDQNFGRRTHNPIRTMMFRHPVAVVDPAVGLGRQLDGVLEGLGGVIVLVHRTLVQDAKCQTVGVHLFRFCFRPAGVSKLPAK